MGILKWRASDETQQERKGSACAGNSCGRLRFYLVDGHGILVDRERSMYRNNVRVLSGWAMTYGCGADGCLTCYPYQYACADCGARWEKPINNGEVYTCEDCEFINNSGEEL